MHSTRINMAAAFHTAFTNNDLDAAEQLVTGLIVGKPDPAIEALTKLALLRRRAGLIGPAIDAFRAAYGVASRTGAPLPDWFYSELSGCHVQKGDWAPALACAEAGHSLKPVLGLTATVALVHLNRLDEARQRLRQAVAELAPDPVRAGPAIAACTTLLTADQDQATRSAVREAADAWSGEPGFDELRATLAVLEQDWATASVLYARTFTHGQAPAALLDRLSYLLRGNPDSTAFEASVAAAAVLAAPDSEPALFRWRDALARAGSNDSITAAMVQLQVATSHALPSVLMELGRRLPIHDLLDRFATQIDLWRRTDGARACKAYLDALCRFDDPGPAAVQAMVAVPELQLRLFFLLREPRLQRIHVREPSASEAATLDATGVDISAVQALLDTMVGPLEPAWDTYLAKAAFASPAAAQIVRCDEGFSAFQDRIVRDRTFAMIDPVGGGQADLFDSVKIHDRQVFSFRGTELVTVQTGGNMNFLLFIHLVRLNLLLLVDTKAAPSKQAFYASDVYVAEVMAVWLRRAARNHAALLTAAAAAPANRGTARRIVAIHGRAENPAHHIWNYLPAFERLVQAGVIGHIDAVLCPPTLYFGPLKGLFPELAGAEHLSLPEAPAIDPCPFDPGAIALQLGSSVIPASLMRRVQDWAERVAPATTQAEISQLGVRHPVIWVGLRVGDKVWVDQAAGVARLIDLMVPLYPDALFLLDGFSLPDDAAAPPEKWRAAAEALQADAEAIAAATSHPTAVRSLVGNRLSESVLWARAVHAYFTPLGSSQHKVGWYSQAPGLVYTTTKLSRHAPDRRQGAWEAEGSPVPDFLIGAVASAGQRRGSHDFRTNLETVAFTAEQAARQLVTILETRPAPAPYSSSIA